MIVEIIGRDFYLIIFNVVKVYIIPTLYIIKHVHGYIMLWFYCL